MLLGCDIITGDFSIHRALFKHPATCVRRLPSHEAEVTPQASLHNWDSLEMTQISPGHSGSHGI